MKYKIEKNTVQETLILKRNTCKFSHFFLK